MAQHILLMNVMAPLAVLAVLNVAPRATAAQLAATTILQLSLIWFWHAPPVFGDANHEAGLHLPMQASLLAAALLFWWSVLSIRGKDRWQPIVALLITSKLFCLLGVLLTFSPRPLFGGLAHEAALADQQLAGLLMLVACPATYLVAGVVVAAKWIGIMEMHSPHPAAPERG